MSFPPTRRPTQTPAPRIPSHATSPAPDGAVRGPSGSWPLAQKERSAAGSLVELVTIVAVALGLALGIQAFLVKPFRIPSESMVPTLDVGQRVLVDRVTLRFGDPDRGDIMVFKPPRGADDNVCGTSPRGAAPVPGPPSSARHQLHQARCRRRRRPRLDPRGPRVSTGNRTSPHPAGCRVRDL